MEEKAQKSVDRRGFLKGAALAGGAMAVAGLAACSSEGSPSTDATGSDAASVGSSNAGVHTWDVAPAAITDIAETKDYDIVIVGAGIAGVSAAEAAARNGASVAVLEQAETYTVHGVDCGHIGSQWQLENGINISPEEATKLLYRWSQQTANRNLIYQWATRSGKVFDYLRGLAESNGLSMVKALSPTAKWDWDQLDELWREYPDAVSFTDATSDIGMFTSEGQMVNSHTHKMLVDSAESNGAEFFYNTHAEQLVGDSSTGISGVIVTDEDGSHKQYNALKGVILATGDISGNQEMIDCWAPIINRSDVVGYTPENGNLGEGILMGMWAGAAHSKCPAAPMVHPINMSENAVLQTISLSWLAVNTVGLRYSAEMPFEPIVTNSRMNQPGNVTWSIYDSNYAIYVQKQFPEAYESMLEGVADKLEAAVAEGSVLKGDTLEDLASQMNVPVSTFTDTVSRYNEHCASGNDVDFGVPERFLAAVEAGPFYAQTIPAMTLVVPFGLHVNDDSQVCTEEDEPIAGLFAVGNVQGEFFANSYPVHCPGISHGRAITFGQLVGEALAKDTVISQTM